MSISFNPMPTTGFSGGFVLSTDGYVQGTFLDDPAIRYQLEGGIISADEDSPIWGGLPLALALPAVGVNAQGSIASIAGSLAEINAWCLFNQAAAGIITPSSNVPLYTAGMSVNFARAGCGLRIVLPVASTTILNDLIGAAPNVDLYWDPSALCLTTTSAANYGPLPVSLEALSATSKIVSYSSPNANWNTSGPAAVVRI